MRTRSNGGSGPKRSRSRGDGNGPWRPGANNATLDGPRRPPLQLVGHPELLVEPRDVAVGGEQVVVVALEQVAAADVDRRRLAAEAGPALVDVDRVAGLGQAHAGHGAGHAGPQDRNPHVSSTSDGSKPTRSPTT